MITSPGTFDNGKIICRVPTLSAEAIANENNLVYNVDIALNGQ